jgi:hypothetical protein
MAHSKTSRHAVVRWPLDEKSDAPAAASESRKGNAQDSTATKDAGHVMHDERGNAVWSRKSGDSTSTMLRRLEVPGLKMEGQEDTPPATRASPAVATAKAPARAEAGGGYNPYDQARALKKPTTPKGPVGRRTLKPR